MNWFEIIGILASLTVAISLMMKNLKALRIINSFGAVIFMVYGWLIGAWSVVGMNFFILCINFWYLLRPVDSKSEYKIYPVKNRKDPYLKIFWDHRKKDIQLFQPDFTWESMKDENIVFVLRETLPIVLFVYTLRSPGEYEIHLDYAVPEYRDLETAKYLFSEGWKSLPLLEPKKFTTFSRVNTHQGYLKALGFKKIQTIGDLEEYSFDLTSF